MIRTLPPVFRIVTVIVAASIGLSSSAHGQNLAQYRLTPTVEAPADATTKMLQMRQQRLRVLGPDHEKNREIFKQVAQTYVYKVTYAEYYTSPTSGELTTKPRSQTLEGVFSDIDRLLLIPDATTKFTLEQKAYIDEFGVALDAAIRDVFKKNPPPIIRVNTTRLLAFVSRTGAPAHAVMIQEMLTNKFFTVKGKPFTTFPEVLYYALEAAENLLAAYDPVGFLLSDPHLRVRHSIPDKDLVPLIQVLEDLVLKGPDVAKYAAPLDPDTSSTEKVAPKAQASPNPAAPSGNPPGNPPGVEGKLVATPMTTEQVALVRYFRRAAVSALAKVRYAEIGGVADIPKVRPTLTLAKVAVADVSINPAPSTSEIGEAVLGLLDLLPSNAFNQSEWLYTIAQGSKIFSTAKSGNTDDQSLPWRVYGARFLQRTAQLRAATAANPRLKLNQKAITDVLQVLDANIYGPMEKGTGPTSQINLDAVNVWLEQHLPSNRSLYTDGAPSTLTPRAPGQ